MNKKEIKTSLSQTSLRKAAKDLRDYKQKLEAQTRELGLRVAKRLADFASEGFASSQVDIKTDGSAWRTAHASVSVTSSGNTSVVLATGSDVIWCEFGAGVYFNGSVGGSPHPKGSELGLTIGGYGKGNGAKDSWKFRSASGVIETHGTPATAPMYRAVVSVSMDIANIAKEVFG